MNNAREDTDIKAAINAVATYAAGQFRRDLARRMTEEVANEVYAARMEGKPIDVSGLFAALAEKYVS